jgi:MoaA/NifB/PqqE/SkfB family radical SAM enzyme
MFDLPQYTDEHRAELEALLQQSDWQEALGSGLVDQVRRTKLSPPPTRPFIDTVVDQLLSFNRPAVGEMIAAGCRDETALLDRLSVWPAELAGRQPRVSFLGLNVTTDCNLPARCVYCNQDRTPSAVEMATWRGVIQQACVGGGEGAAGPYIYVTGGEPLLLGEALWGADGLVAFATRCGGAVNINTNGVLLGPAVALRLVQAGLGKLHVSLDTADEPLHDFLRAGRPLSKVLRGLYNIQLARDLAGVSYPVVHTNCVLTNRNLHGFPALVGLLLAKRKTAVVREDPFREDLLPHVIPVGGDGNAGLRPSAEEFRLFYQDIWPAVVKLWSSYQDDLAVPADKRRELLGYFTNPFLRVEHGGGLAAYVQASAEGRYGRCALSRHCYVAPTQAAITPDGSQYRCGCHAIRGFLSVGNVRSQDLYAGIRRGIAGLEELPQERHCYGCAMATLYINQSVESRLKKTVQDMLAGS